RYLTASRLAFAGGRHDEAESALEAGLFIAAQLDFPRLLAHLVAERLRQLGLRGRTREAQAMLERPEIARYLDGDPSPGDRPETTDERWAAVWARGAILREDAASAVPVLRRWFAFLRPTHCHRVFVRMGALLAHAQAASGEANAALRTLRETLGAMQDGGFLRTVVDEGPLVMELIGQLRAGLSEGECALRPLLDRLLDRSASTTPLRATVIPLPTPSSPCADACEGLSARELEIVRLSAEGMATADIARAAHLSENTVKWYWQRIFEKLDVHRRFDAIRVARKHRWLA
ncbi:MAG: LuxR C-terminal-related transcriptional regulator, partial [Panacagrimonas sp.]